MIADELEARLPLRLPYHLLEYASITPESLLISFLFGDRKHYPVSIDSPLSGSSVTSTAIIAGLNAAKYEMGSRESSYGGCTLGTRTKHGKAAYNHLSQVTGGQKAGVPPTRWTH